MIEKFRRKFIAFATGAVFLLLLVILGTINIVNFSMVANEADEVTSKLAEEGGRFEGRMAPPWAPIPQKCPCRPVTSRSASMIPAKPRWYRWN